MKKIPVWLSLALLTVGCVSVDRGPLVTPVIDFDTESSVTYEAVDSSIDLIDGEDDRALEINFHNVQNPKVVFTLPEPQDWTDRMLAYEVTNPTGEAVKFYTRVDCGESSDGLENTLSFIYTIEAGATETLMLTFKTENADHGMREFGNFVASSWGDGVDLTHMTAFHIWQWDPFKTSTIIVDDIRLIENPADSNFTDGIVDAWGQYTRGDWPGKVSSDADLSAEAEEAALLSPGEVPGRSIYGGWLNEDLRCQATGFFHTEKLDGRWWLIDPEGWLYYSTGMDIIRLDDMNTMITGRENMFTWLPEQDEPLGDHYAYAEGIHTGPVSEGPVYNFYKANLQRKYGNDWYDRWTETAVRRSVSWGFTSLGNWCEPGFVGRGEELQIPYTAHVWITGEHNRLSSGNDYWWPMHDPYDPLFAENVRLCVEEVADQVNGDPWCMGIFVDNELSWGNTDSDQNHYGIIFSALRYHESLSPAKQSLMEILYAKYASIEELNSSWDTEFRSWDKIAGSFNAAYYLSTGMREDLSLMLEAYAERYYRIVREEVKRVLPDHLYLGSRMPDWSRPEEVTRAAARFCDVVSFNNYTAGLDSSDYWILLEELDVPCIIGEFSFGAKDRGLFGGGPAPVIDQASRAESYRHYLETVLENPYFVGAHWFQYVDEPLTGRAWDGENYNIGFVSVADIPYVELVEAATEINMNCYRYRTE